MPSPFPPTTWLSPLLVQPAPPLEPLLLRLGPLELLSAGRWLPITLVYTSTMHDTIALRSSLASALVCHPIFAGRMHWTVPSIDSVASRVCVRVDEATSGVMFSEGSSSLALSDVVVCPSATMWHARERMVKQCFLPPTASSPKPKDVRTLIRDSIPLLHVSVVHLRDGGTVICAEFAHGICDGGSCFEFLSSWAAATIRGSTNTLATPTSHDNRCVNSDTMSITKGPYDWIRQALHDHPPQAPSSWLFVSSTPKVHQTFAKGTRLVHSAIYRLSAAQLDRLKAASSHQHGRISTNDAVSAFIWRVTSSLPGRLHRPSHLRMLMNFRPDLTLHRQVPGNMVYSIVASDSQDSPASTSPLGALASLCRAAVDTAKASVIADLGAVYAKPWTRIFWNEPADTSACVTYVTNLSRYNFCSLPLAPGDPRNAPRDSHQTSAMDQLESPYGAFPYLFQLYADPRCGVRVVAHLPQDEREVFDALWGGLLPRPWDS
ncbi:hypothetical protein DYB36_001329 [Aphanomyces astaci]|uniref:Condensation domain-containing protein n=1 Tax=Aphanomyces astaci TaxID=112090 RepID=A0A397AQP3_APHAT|nr:hypothetical protein DYB36_001329 [Aphanomyces astaci]